MSNFELMPLPYELNGLAPHISESTMKLHHGKHYATYVNNLNQLLSGSNLANKTLEEIIQLTYGKEDKKAIFNNAGQIFNHEFYFKSIAPNGGGKPYEKTMKRISADFGSYEQFYQKFKEASTTLFGSGWVWLVLDPADDHMKIIQTFNADSPITKGQKPLLTLDVWEHAYYLDHNNRRADYVSTFLTSLVNWEFVDKNI